MEQGWVKIALLALGSALLLAMLPEGVRSQATDEYTVSGRQVAVYNLAGRVEVGPASGSGVVVQVLRGGRDADRLEVEVSDVGGWQALVVRYPSDEVVYPEMGRGSSNDMRVRSDGTFGHGGRGGDRVRIRGSGSGMEAWADLRISVPRGQRFSLYLGAGPTEASNVDGEIRIDTGSGSVEARNMSGALVIDTGSGRIDLRGAEGEVELDTGSGSVHVYDVRGPRLSVDTGSGSVRGGNLTARSVTVDTGSGGVELENVTSSDVLVDTGSGSVEIDLTQDFERLEVDTGSGSVTLRMPESVGAEIEVDTGSGGIDLDLPVQIRTIRRTYLQGTIGDGSGRITVDTGSGSVRILRR